MIAKIKRGSGFRGAINYALNEGKNRIEGKEAVLIGGNMTGTTAKELATEFKQCRKLRPEVSRPVWMESLRPEGTADLSPEQWNQIATAHMKAIGLDPDKHMHCIVLHPQDNHPHIVASRIDIDGNLYLGRNENLIAAKDCRRIEKEYGLQQLPEKSIKAAKHLTKNEIEMKDRTGEVPPREKLQNIISESLADRPTQTVFEKRLVDAGVSFKKSTGGYSYEIDGVAFKGSQLGKDFKQSAIQSKIAPAIITPPPVVEVKIKLPPTPTIVDQVQPAQVQKSNPLIAKPDVQPVRAFMSEANAPTTALNENKPSPQPPAVDSAVLMKLKQISDSIARLTREYDAGKVYEDFYDRNIKRLVDEIKEMIKNGLKGLSLNAKAKCPIQINNVPINDLVANLPQEASKPVQTKGRKS